MSKKTRGPSIDDSGRRHLLDALESLQKSGCIHQDEREIWCPVWLRVDEDSNASMESKARSAKETLKKIKSTRKALEALSSSLEEAVRLVSDQSSNAIRVMGFSSLPDDVLARIFELHHQHDMENVKKGTGMASISASNVLVQVCRRFRSIALRIPSLWEDICNYHRDAWILNLKERSKNPVIFITYGVPNAGNSVNNLLRLVHPENQWRGLNFRFKSRTHWHHFSQRFSKTSEGGDFRSLESLSIVQEWDDEAVRIDNISRPAGEGPQALELDFTPEGEDEYMSRTFSTLLSEWNLPELKTLTLRDIIPLKINCPNLQAVNFEISYPTEDTYWWDRQKLAGFLHSLHLVESLSFTFKSPILVKEDEDDTGLNSIKFSRLKSFTLNIAGDTRDYFLADLMRMMDMTTISKLNISMAVWHIGDEDCPPVKFGIPMGWLNAIFNLPHDDDDSGDGRTCMFPNVEKLHIGLEDYNQWIPFSRILDATPLVRDLTLDLPHCREPYPYNGHGLYCTYQTFPCQHLKTVRIVNCNLFSGPRTLRFFESLKRNKEGELTAEDVERIEIEGCNNLRSSRDDFSKYFGERLVWSA